MKNFSLRKVARRSRDGRSVVSSYSFRREKKAAENSTALIIHSAFFEGLAFGVRAGTSAALLVLLAASAGAGIINADFLAFVALGSCFFAPVAAC